MELLLLPLFYFNLTHILRTAILAVFAKFLMTFQGRIYVTWDGWYICIHRHIKRSSLTEAIQSSQKKGWHLSCNSWPDRCNLGLISVAHKDVSIIVWSYQCSRNGQWPALLWRHCNGHPGHLGDRPVPQAATDHKPWPQCQSAINDTWICL